MKKDGRRSCFVISMLGGDGSDNRKHADKFMRIIVEKAIGEIYEVERADKIDEQGRITTQIIKKIYNADLIIANLSTYNANVFYELAIADCFEKPVVMFISPKEAHIPFDMTDMRVIKYDENFDFEDATNAQESLMKFVNNIDLSKIENPYTTAMASMKQMKILDKLKESKEDTPQEALLEVLGNISRDMDRLGAKIDRINLPAIRRGNHVPKKYVDSILRSMKEEREKYMWFMSKLDDVFFGEDAEEIYEDIRRACDLDAEEKLDVVLRHEGSPREALLALRNSI